MKTKTLILAIFSLLALANAGDREALRPSKAYADPNAQQPAYAYPGYQQPTAKRLAKRAAHKLADDINKKFAEAQIDTNPDPPADKAYAHPGYEQPAYKRLAKRAAPVEKTNDYDYDHAAYPGYQTNAISPYRYGPTAERLAKREAPAPYAYPNDYHVAAAYPGPAPVTKIQKINIVERLAKREAPAPYAYPDYGYNVAAGLGGYGPYGAPPALAPDQERLAKRDAVAYDQPKINYVAPTYAYPGYQVYPVAPVVW